MTPTNCPPLPPVLPTPVSIIMERIDPAVNSTNFRRWCLKMQCLMLVTEDRKKGLS